MKIDKKQLDEIIDLIWDWTDYDVDTYGYHDYDVVPSLPTKIRQDLLEEVNKIIATKKKWWRLRQ